MKRPRYHDVYNEAFNHKKTLAGYVEELLQSFHGAPQRLLHVPRYLDTMLRTQAIAHRDDGRLDRRSIWHAMRVSRFVQRRAARIITRQALHCIYRPDGPWLRKCVKQHLEDGLLRNSGP